MSSSRPWVRERSSSLRLLVHPVDLADLLVEDPGGGEAAEHAGAAGPRACGVPQLWIWVGCRRDDRLGDHGGVVPGLHPLRQDGFEGLPSPLVDRQWVL